MTQQLNPPKVCPNCKYENSFTRDPRQVCYMCDQPLVAHQSATHLDIRTSNGFMNNFQSIKSFMESEVFASLKQLGRRKVWIVGTGCVGIFLLGSGIFLGTKNTPSSAAFGAKNLQVTLLGDTFAGYTLLRGNPFRKSLKDSGMDLDYRHEFDQETRAELLSTGEADLMVTTIDQVVKHRPKGKIVALWDHTKDADAVVLNARKFSLLQDLESLEKEVSIAAQSGDQYSLVYAAGTPSEYLALLLAKEFPGFRLDQFDLIPVSDASEAHELLENPDQNIAAAILWEPYVSKAIKQGSKVVFTSADVPETIVDVVVASDKFIERHPEKLSQFVNAAYSRVNSAQFDRTRLKQQIIAQSNPKISDSEALKILNGIDFFNATEASTWIKDGILAQKLAFTEGVLFASGRLDQPVGQHQELFTGRFLNLAIAQKSKLDQQLSGRQPQVLQAQDPQPVQAAKPVKPVKITQDIHFELSGVLLDQEDKQAIDTVLATAQGFGKDTQLKITGHTAESGYPGRNEILIKNQLVAVTRYIREKQYPGELMVKRPGSRFPLSGFAPDDPQNQRVNITIVTGG